MIRVVLVDDEENALDMLKLLLEQIENVLVVGKYTNPLLALQEIEEKQPDAVFLDIHMPGMSGMDGAKEIFASHPNTHIVFTTAYSEYAVEAFAIGSLDYVMKPITLERLRNSIQRIEKFTKVPDLGQSQPTIVCMGDFSVFSMESKGGRLAWRTQKEKELCAFLCHHAGQVVDQAVIIEALWPDSDAEKSRSYLYTCVSLLRGNLRRSGVSISVHKVGYGYSLEFNGLVCDWIELQTYLDKAILSDTFNAHMFERITALYTNDYLRACDYRWAMQKQAEISGRYIRFMRKICEFHRRKHQTSSAIECLQRVLKIYPDSERDGRDLMNLHMETGNRNQAIEVYRQLSHAVQVELDAELEEETVFLYNRIMSSGN